MQTSDQVGRGSDVDPAQSADTSFETQERADQQPASETAAIENPAPTNQVASEDPANKQASENQEPASEFATEDSAKEPSEPAATEAGKRPSDPAEGVDKDFASEPPAKEVAVAAPAKETKEPTNQFQNLGLSPSTLNALTSAGFSEPTPVQAQAIPELMNGHDVIVQAATGTGKTAAFALPIIESLQQQQRNAEQRKQSPAALILVPTRELAIQVTKAFHTLGTTSKMHTVAVYGGQSIGQQIASLKKGVDVVVATPGRAVDLIDRGLLKLQTVSQLVLDEADEMLDMGFAEELDRVISEVPEERQTALFSATMPSRLRSIAARRMTNPKHVTVKRKSDSKGVISNIHHVVYLVDRQHKLAALGRLLDFENPRAALVFGRSRDQVDELADEMSKRGYRAEALHGGMSQEQRDKTMNRLRSGLTNLLIATDVAARGLDIDHLTHVVNYDVPMQAETYVHRSGRVGRAGRSGTSIVIGGRSDKRRISLLEKTVGKQFEYSKLPSVSALKQRQLESTTEQLREAVIAGSSDAHAAAVEQLAAEFSSEKLAAAAFRLLHESRHTHDIAEIPDVENDERRPRKSQDKFNKFRDSQKRPGSRPTGNPRLMGNRRDVASIYVGIGRDSGVRPKDLVGAIANEAGVRGDQIGGIDIAPRFAIVEVPKHKAQDVIAALRSTTIKGRKVPVRKDRNR